MKQLSTKHGFTLIELLVVIAIISLLAGLLFPAVSSSLNTAKKARARAACQSIETAIVTYSNEYNGKLPVPTYSETDTINPTEAESKQILMVLMNIGTTDSTNHALNPKGIVFLETDFSLDTGYDGEYLDPWGTQYRIILDENLDGKIDYYTEDDAQHRKKTVVVSAGKNKTFGDKDDVANVVLPLTN